MLRILFLVLWSITFISSSSQGAIEIYADGNKFNSIQAYQTSEKKADAQTSATPSSLNNQQEDYIRQKAKQLGIDVDFSKIKTFQVGQGDVSDDIRHKLYVLSVENGVVGALQDFYQSRGELDFQLSHHISSNQLQEAIKEAVTKSDAPKLLIAEPGKLRIMSLKPDHTT